MRNYTLEDFRRNIDNLTSTPEIFRKNFNKLQDVLYDICGIEYYKSFEDFMAEHRDSYTLDVLLDSLKEFPNDNKPLAKGDTVCYCYTYNELVHSFEKEEDAIESIRELVIEINLLLRKGYEEDSIRTIMNNVLKESANPSESDSIKYYVQNITNYGMNCYSRYEEDIVRIFAEHGIKFDNHSYGYASEYTCPGGLMRYSSTSSLFRTRRADFDEKAKDIMNEICKILPKNKEFDWQGKTVHGCIRNGTVRFAK